MKTLLTLVFSGACFAAPLDQIEKSLDSGEKAERMRAVAALNKTIDDSKLSNEARLEAIQLAVDKNVHESSGMIIKYIDTYWIRKKSAMSFEEKYPSVEALIALGEKVIPDLIQEMKKEDDKHRQRLIGYSLLRILKRDAALEKLDAILTTDLSDAEQARLKAAKAEIAKWSDYPWDARNIKK